MPRSLKKNFLWTAGGNIFYAATQWVVLIILARLGSQEEVGEFSLATAIATPVFAFANLKLRSVQATDALDEFGFGTYLAVRIATVSIAVSAVIAFLVFAGFSTPFVFVAMMLAVSKAIESVSDIFHGLQQRHEHMEIITRSLLLKGSLSVVMFVYGYLVGNSLLSGVIGLAGAWVITLFVFDIPQGRQRIGCVKRGSKSVILRPEWDLKVMKQLIVLSFPLGATVAIGSLSSNVPRYFTGGMLSSQELGVFAAISYFMVAGNLIMSAISQAATPRLAVLYRNGKVRSHLRLVLQLLALGVAVGAIGIVLVVLLGDFVLQLVYGPEYSGYGRLFLLIMVNGAISYSYVFLGTALTSMKRFNVQLPVHVVGLLVLVLSSVLMVPRMGLEGVPIAMIMSNIFQATAYGVILARMVKEPELRTSEVSDNS